MDRDNQLKELEEKYGLSQELVKKIEYFFEE